MGGVELICENVGVGVDDAEEIIDGVRDSVDFGGGERIETARIVHKLHRYSLSERLARSVALDGVDDSVLERGRVDFVEQKRAGGASGIRRALELRVGDWKQSDDRHCPGRGMELPGGQKLLCGRVTEIKQQSVPALDVQAAQSIAQRGRT